MNNLRLLVLVVYLSGCAGIPLPFTDARFAHWPVESDRQETNSSCIDLATLNGVAKDLEDQHLEYIWSKEDNLAIKAGYLVQALGSECQARLTKLSTAEIKQELFGDIQTITDSSRLRELGGYSFDYQDVSTKSEFELTLHLKDVEHGPKRRLVAIYRLADEAIIHYNYSGIDNVDRRSRSWPIEAFFKAVAGTASKAVIP